MLFNLKTYSYLFLALLIIAFQLLIIYFLKEQSFFIIITLIAIFFILSFNYYTKFNLYVWLIGFSLMTFVYLDDKYSYYFEYRLMQDIFLFLFLLFISSIIFYKEKTINYNKSKLDKTFIFLFGVILLSIFVGFVNNKDIYWIRYEAYNYMYYLLYFPFIYILNKDKEYDFLFKLIILISTIIALQYIYNNLSFDILRYTTFHAGLFPIPISILFVHLFYSKNVNNKLISIILISFLFLASFLVLTRSLWLGIIASIFLLTSFILSDKYPQHKKRIKHFTIILGTIIILTSLFFIISTVTSSQQIQITKNTAAERAESFVSAQKDASLLMRIELGYYAVQKFISSPIYGEGFGGKISYKLLGKGEIVYPDMSWLYFLWKTGIIGFFVMILIFYYSLKIAISNFHQSTILQHKILSLGIWGGFIGILAQSFFSSNLIMYKSNLIYILCITYLEFVRRTNVKEIKDA